MYALKTYLPLSQANTRQAQSVSVSLPPLCCSLNSTPIPPPLTVLSLRRFVKHNIGGSFPPFAILAVRSTELLFIHALRYSYSYSYTDTDTDTFASAAQKARDMPITHATNNEVNRGKGGGEGTYEKQMENLFTYRSHFDAA